MTENEDYLPCIEIEPEKPAQRSVIWLHGLGADGNDFVPIVPELHLPKALAIRFVFPHAPVMPITINSGYPMRAWYDITSLVIEANKTIDMHLIEQSINAVNKLIQREITRGVPTKNIMLAGFSQGAVIALMTGFCYPASLAGLIALSGYLPNARVVLEKANQANAKTPIFIAHGTYDPIVPYRAGETASILLTQAHYNVTWRNYPIPHSVSVEEILDLANWIKGVWQT